jgi:hypothetical protein
MTIRSPSSDDKTPRWLPQHQKFDGLLPFSPVQRVPALTARTRVRWEYCQRDWGRGMRRRRRDAIRSIYQGSVLMSLPQIIGRGLAPPDRLHRRDAHAFSSRVQVPFLLTRHGSRETRRKKQPKLSARNTLREARTRHQPWEISAAWRAPFPVPGK